MKKLEINEGQPKSTRDRAAVERGIFPTAKNKGDGVWERTKEIKMDQLKLHCRSPEM